jgi:hypothetical protein
MTNQETNSAESQSQSDAALAHQHETSVPTGEQREREPSRQISKSDKSEGRFFWLSILFDALLFLATCVYAFFAYHQWQAMNRQADIFKTQAEVMSRQLESMQSSSAHELLLRKSAGFRRFLYTRQLSFCFGLFPTGVRNVSLQYENFLALCLARKVSYD